jgi:hypothetical protein
VGPLGELEQSVEIQGERRHGLDAGLGERRLGGPRVEARPGCEVGEEDLAALEPAALSGARAAEQ